MEQTTPADNVTDVETDTRLFITDVETDTRQIDSIHLWHVLVCLVIGIIGIIGNCLTLIVFFRRKPWDSVNVLIVIMSISDLLTMPLLNRYIVPKSSPTESRHPETSHYFRFRSCCKQWTRGLFGRSKYLILYYHVFILDFEKHQAWRTDFKDLCRNGTHDISGDGSPNCIRLRAIDAYSAI